MNLSLRPAGERGVLIEFEDAADRRLLDDVLSARPLPGLIDQVPALRTLLLTFATASDLHQAVDALATIDLDLDGTRAGENGEVVEIPVRYDGEDLPDVARLLDLSVDDVIARHTGQLWTVDFAGFMPGFGYCTGETGGLDVPRLTTPRTKIPAGSVALAGEFTSIYPQASPGGWRLIGSTDVQLWDLERTPPALLAPGRRIRFVEVGR